MRSSTLPWSKKKHRIETSGAPRAERISVILPVLNEAPRIGKALAGLISQPQEVSEILVVDGGSTDDTRAIVAKFSACDNRVHWIDATPIDPQWTGKAWGLHCGLGHTQPACRWILCVDADVEVSRDLARSLLAHTKKTGISVLSVATLQKLSGKLEALIHPSMLTSLIYRFGSPGGATRDRHKVQANGQCFFAPRDILIRTDAFRTARSSLCEDITIARRLAECGESVGFYEADGLVSVTMYDHWREAWDNWPRSLPMRDQYFGWHEALNLIGALILQALPLPLFLSGLVRGGPLCFLILTGALLALRLGILIGVARAYPDRPWSYWLSPLADLPVALRILQLTLRRRHRWRGRTYVRRKGGVFEPLV
jgi:dolichol-phosphate mannosyltransferase